MDRGSAQIREEIFALDPYHPTFGTSACGEGWRGQEEGFGLAALRMLLQIAQRRAQQPSASAQQRRDARADSARTLDA